MQKTELVGIQYLRGFCAIAVVADHASAMASFKKYFGEKLLDGTLEHGALGVDIFFVISGFIISIISLSENSLNPEIGVKEFFWKRFARIVPTMWVAILSYAILRHMGSSTVSDPWEYFRAFFLIPWGEVDPNQIWTLRHEAIFYGLFAISFLGRSTLRPILFVWFLSPIFIVIIERMGLISGVENDSFVGILFRDCNMEFGVGFLIGIIRLKWLGKMQFYCPIHPFPSLLFLTVGVIAFGALSQHLLPPILARLVIAMLAGLLVGLAAYVACPRDGLTRFGELLGNASFSIYLFHAHFESALLAVMAKFTPLMPITWVVAIVSLLATIGAIAAYFFVEKPLVRFVQKKNPATMRVALN